MTKTFDRHWAKKKSDPALRHQLCDLAARRRFPFIAGYCCVDTGTRISVIDIGVMEALGIEPTSMQVQWRWGRLRERSFPAPVFAARMEFPGSTLEPLILRDFAAMSVD